MEPRLIAISGSYKGTIFALSADEVSIGREGSNTVCLNDPSVSRRHCVLTRLGERSESSLEAEAQQTAPGWTIVDLESFNGTFVNGVPVREQTVAHGDQIAVGDVVLLLVQQDSEGTTEPVQLSEGDLITRSTVRLRQEDALYLRPDKVIAELPITARI
ncbi:MAG TPA: FHA domain-containing protein, partial [Pyrinomonadaceae bacterium]|nr:FHA domain-containing protein [Pyrinomonadaceae bacterium]